MESIKVFTDCQLANHLYRMVPEVWQAEYEKTKPLPNSVRTLLTDLEDIEASEKIKSKQDQVSQPKKENGKRVLQWQRDQG